MTTKRKAKNILYIMYDQLRFDYLSCAGHPTLKTPNMDWLAENGVRFTRAYVQSPVCGASRMSAYTGRYVHSHGAAWNGFPLKVGELTLGDHLRDQGMDAWLVGKTHMRPDKEGLARFGIDVDSLIGARVSEAGFDVYVRDDGMFPVGPDGEYDPPNKAYNQALQDKGYPGDNPWHDYANSGINEDGSIASGFAMFNAGKQANVKEEDSETPWLTDKAIDFLDNGPGSEDKPWLCHLSYIKPHWPYIVPAPYNDMYGPNHVPAATRAEDELRDQHPVYAAYSGNVIGQAFAREDVRQKVIPAYMGLIKQCDDQLGRLLDHLRETGRLEDTMIILTADHGDYLGDHWLGEKDLFHEPSVKVPCIIYDPSSEADTTRGTTCDALVENIDLVATSIDVAGGKGASPRHIVEGRSLLPFLHGEEPESWRDFAVSEYQYGMTPMANKLGVAPQDARLVMIADKRWKFMHAEGGFRPMLFDMDKDPDELNDIGRTPEAYEEILELMYDRLRDWALRESQRTTMSDQTLITRRGTSRRKGIVLGLGDESEVDPEIIQKYQGMAERDYTKPSSKP